MSTYIGMSLKWLSSQTPKISFSNQSNQKILILEIKMGTCFYMSDIHLHTPEISFSNHSNRNILLGHIQLLRVSFSNQTNQNIPMMEIRKYGYVSSKWLSSSNTWDLIFYPI